MRILLINDYATPTYGAELGTLRLREGLRNLGHDARIFASSARNPSEAGFADYECLGTNSHWRTLLQTANPWALVRLRRVLAEFSPDVVHVRMFLTQLSPLILLVLRRVPSLYHVVWYRPVCPLGTKTLPDHRPCEVTAGYACYRNRCLPLHDWLPLMLQRRLWRRWRDAFDLIVANSEAVRRSLLADGIKPVEVALNGVPVESARRFLAPRPFAVFAGRLVAEKGADVLLRAFALVVAQIPKAKLLLVGDGPELGRLKDLNAELKLNSAVSMPGFVPHAEVERLCGGAWVQVVPSRWAEPFGKAAAEAMMRETAVIASDSGGLAEIVQHERTGILIPPGDPFALAEAMLRLFRDRALAERMGKAGREAAVLRFSEQAWIDRFIALYLVLYRSKSRHLSAAQEESL